MKTPKLPAMLAVGDYHDLDGAQDNYDILKCGIKVTEIGFDGQNYLGLVYSGRLTDAKNKAMLAKIEKLIDARFDECEGD